MTDPGVEYVPRVANLKGTDVRYDKSAEEGGAVRIVELLPTVGVSVKVAYLSLEDGTRVRPNHLEVWFASGVRETAIR